MGGGGSGVTSTPPTHLVRPRGKKRTRTLLPSTRAFLESKNHPGYYEMEHIQLHQYKLEKHYNWETSDLPTLTLRVGDPVRVKLKGNLEEDYFSVVGRWKKDANRGLKHTKSINQIFIYFNTEKKPSGRYNIKYNYIIISNNN